MEFNENGMKMEWNERTQLGKVFFLRSSSCPLSDKPNRQTFR